MRSVQIARLNVMLFQDKNIYVKRQLLKQMVCVPTPVEISDIKIVPDNLTKAEAENHTDVYPSTKQSKLTSLSLR